MSEDKFNTNSHLEHEIDLLVDGELDEARRGDLLRRLDDEPQSWRRCALRFVESQCLHEDLHDLMSVARGPQTIAGSSLAGARPAARPSWRVIVSIAACVAMAFGIGLLSQDLLFPSGTGQPSERQFAQSNPGPKADDSSRPHAGGRGEFPQTWVVGAETDLSPEVINELERLGHRVERTQEFWPVGLGDGGVGLMPMERVDIHYVGDSYQ